MGFIPSALNQPEQWRVWSNMGLDFILAEPGSDARIFWDNAKQCFQNKQSPQSGQGKQTEAKQPHIDRPEAVKGTVPSPTFKQTKPGEPAAHQAGPAANASLQAAKQTPYKQEPAQPLKQSVKSTPKEPVSLPLLENLPNPWPLFASKSKPGRPLLWTYQELGLDLSGKADPTRSNMIKKIITTLKLPAGSSNFWPHSLPEQTPQGQEFIQKPDFFAQGFAALEPQFLLAFGKPSLEAIIPSTNSLPYSYTNYNNKVLIYLPSLEELEDGQKFRKSIEFLQAFTLPCFGG